jgi:hypothetical protein
MVAGARVRLRGFSENTASNGIRFLGDILFAYGSTALALGYGAAIVLLAQRPGWQPVLQPLRWDQSKVPDIK